MVLAKEFVQEIIGISWFMFYGQLKRMRILLLLSGMFFKCQLHPFG